MLRTWIVQGVARAVGTVVVPTEAEVKKLLGEAFLHDVIGELPPPPDVVDYVTAAEDALGTMLGNGPDSTLPPGQEPVGDCICAEDMHLAAMRSCNAGAPWVPTTPQTLDLYSAVTGFKVGDPSTDNGTDPLALIKYRLAGNPYPDGSKVLAAHLVDTSSPTRVRQAVAYADGCFCWASMPDAWENEEEAGAIWDVAGPPNFQNGHGFGVVSYGTQRLKLSTWGIVKPQPIRLTYAAATKYLTTSAGGGMVAFLGTNAFNAISGKCPAGFDLSTAQKYIDSLGVSVV